MIYINLGGNKMTIEEVLNIYKTGYRICQVLEISRQNFSVWMKKGYIPYRQQLKLEALTEGKLKADLEMYLKQKH